MVVGIAVGLTALVALILTAFAYPATHAFPNSVPIAIVGPAPVTDQLPELLSEQAGEDGFEVQTLSDPAAAVQAIKDREIYGAIVLGPHGGRVFISSAASPAVAQLLTAIAADIPTESGPPKVTDVVALPEADPRGSAIPSALLPLIVASIGSAALVFMWLKGVGAQLAAVTVTAISAGLGMTLILSTWLDALPGPFVALWGTFGLAIASMSVLTLGLSRLTGVAGIGVGAFFLLFLGNPLSGATSAPELLPDRWGALGQFLPPGASVSLLRSTGYFDGAGSGMPLVILSTWLAVGVGLAALASRRDTRKTPHP